MQLMTEKDLNDLVARFGPGLPVFIITEDDGGEEITAKAAKAGINLPTQFKEGFIAIAKELRTKKEMAMVCQRLGTEIAYGALIVSTKEFDNPESVLKSHTARNFLLAEFAAYFAGHEIGHLCFRARVYNKKRGNSFLSRVLTRYTPYPMKVRSLLRKDYGFKLPLRYLANFEEAVCDLYGGMISTRICGDSYPVLEKVADARADFAFGITHDIMKKMRAEAAYHGRYHNSLLLDLATEPPVQERLKNANENNLFEVCLSAAAEICRSYPNVFEMPDFVPEYFHLDRDFQKKVTEAASLSTSELLRRPAFERIAARATLAQKRALHA